jgi:hypothetical protein
LVHSHASCLWMCMGMWRQRSTNFRTRQQMEIPLAWSRRRRHRDATIRPYIWRTVNVIT